MKIEHAGRSLRGAVTQLAYVGDDGLPVASGKAPLVAAAGLLLALWLCKRR